MDIKAAIKSLNDWHTETYLFLADDWTDPTPADEIFLERLNKEKIQLIKLLDGYYK